jgi:hypothetical protein
VWLCVSVGGMSLSEEMCVCVRVYAVKVCVCV